MIKVEIDTKRIKELFIMHPKTIKGMGIMVVVQCGLVGVGMFTYGVMLKQPELATMMHRFSTWF